jgi:hypothetical protein
VGNVTGENSFPIEYEPEGKMSKQLEEVTGNMPEISDKPKVLSSKLPISTIDSKSEGTPAGRGWKDSDDG